MRRSDRDEDVSVRMFMENCMTHDLVFPDSLGSWILKVACLLEVR